MGFVVVRIIKQKGPSALVEWRERGSLKRAFVPAKTIQDGRCEKAELDLGVPCGEAWEEFIARMPTPGKIAEALRKDGIWTMQDLFEHSVDAKRVFQSFCGQAFSQFMRATRGGKKT